MPYASLLRGRVSIPGHYYLITTTTEARRTLFVDTGAARIVVNAVRGLDADRHCETLALVVMPDHVHWLFRLGMFLSLSEVVRRFKARSSRELRMGLDSMSVWQHGFHDHAIRSDESLAQIARYIIENPVRAGLVPRISDYPLWYSAWDLDMEGGLEL
jgi:putative transposase